jgi:hypothetical protein
MNIPTLAERNTVYQGILDVLAQNKEQFSNLQRYYSDTLSKKAIEKYSLWPTDRILQLDKPSDGKYSDSEKDSLFKEIISSMICQDYDTLNFEFEYKWDINLEAINSWFKVHNVLLLPELALSKSSWIMFKNDLELFEKTDMWHTNINFIYSKVPYIQTGPRHQFHIPTEFYEPIQLDPVTYFTPNRVENHTQLLECLHTLHDMYLDICVITK